MFFLVCCFRQLPRIYDEHDAHVESHPADRFILGNLCLLHQRQLQSLVIERDSNDDTRRGPCPDHEMMFDHIVRFCCLQQSRVFRFQTARAGSRRQTRCTTIPTFRSRDASWSIVSKLLELAGQMLRDAKCQGKDTGKTSSTIPPLSFANTTRTLRGTPSPDGGRSGSCWPRPHKCRRAEVPYRSPFFLVASPDVPARGTAIVNGVSSVGWLAYGLTAL